MSARSLGFNGGVRQETFNHIPNRVLNGITFGGHMGVFFSFQFFGFCPPWSALHGRTLQVPVSGSEIDQNCAHHQNMLGVVSVDHLAQSSALAHIPVSGSEIDRKCAPPQKSFGVVSVEQSSHSSALVHNLMLGAETSVT